MIDSLPSGGAGPDYEVVLVLDGGEPPPESLWAGLGPRVHLEVLGTRSGAGAARNAGARRARGEFLLFLDDDVRITTRWWPALLAHLEAGHQVLTGTVTTDERSLLSQAREHRYRARYAGVRAGHPVDFFAGGNSVVPRELFLRLGGFPDSDVGSDNRLVTRVTSAGRHVVFAPDLAVVHVHDRGWRPAVTNAFRSGRDARVRSLLPEFVTAASGGRPPVRVVNLLLLAARAAGALFSRGPGLSPAACLPPGFSQRRARSPPPTSWFTWTTSSGSAGATSTGTCCGTEPRRGGARSRNGAPTAASRSTRSRSTGRATTWTGTAGACGTTAGAWPT
jgi:hypothetical protein